MGTDVYYRMFETYYKQASDAEKENNPQKAKTMYLHASESLLKSARETDGEMKAALVRRADKLQKLAELIELPEKKEEPKKVASKTVPTEKQADDESETVWKNSASPNVHFSDIAGLNDVKESINKRIILPRRYPEIYKDFHREVSGGILLYGPPGTGKTMIAKAIATEVNATFFSVRCSDIVGKYFGEAEKNVKNLFETARAEKDAVIFFDEFEALASQRGGHSTVMNRLVPELLSQMDGFSGSEKNNLLILAATNRPWDIDSAFLRPPRLTEKIYVGLPDTEARLFLIQKAFDGVPGSEDLDMDDIAERTDDYNAADIVALCGEIKDIAIIRSIQNGKTSEISMRDVEQGLEHIHSSVKKQDVEQTKKWEAGNK